jgi:plastocyanin
MRFNALALVTSAIVLVGCGGGDTASDSANAPAGGAAPGAPGGGATAGTATAAPITGTTHTVRMVGDGNSYRFDPATISAKAGDGIRFISVSGPPHNVAFSPDSVSDSVEPQLMANMPESVGLEGKYLTQPNEEWVLSLGNIPAGRYPIHCTPHLMYNMRGVINVTP